VVARVATLANDTYDDVSSLDGSRVETDAGWFLVRASGIELSITYTTSDERPLTAVETVTTDVDADDDGDEESVYSFTLSG